MNYLRRLLGVPTWLRIALAGTRFASWYTRLNVFVYGRSGGRLWGNLYVPSNGSLVPILLLDTRGRRTGQVRTTPVIYLDRGGTLLLAAANAGHGRPPAWFLNLGADPRVKVRIRDRSFAAKAVVLPTAERKTAFAAFARMYPPLLQYQRATQRTIAMVALQIEPDALDGQRR